VKFNHADVEFTVVCEPDESAVRGNAMASGDDAADIRCENEILERLDRGDVWAWCSVKVIGEVHGVRRESSWLGACNYADERDFRECGYFEDMCAEVIEQLENVQ
jgi:hypothetical protein